MAYWAREPESTGQVVVFVHGFKGEAVGTWRSFEKLLPNSAACRDTDLIFWGHDGGRTDIRSNGAELCDFLSGLWHSPNDFRPWGPHRKSSFRYSKLVVVAHSLGAVISRQAMLMAHGLLLQKDQGGAWLRGLKTIFFAPAYSGTDLPRLFGEVITGTGIPIVGNLLSIAAQAKWKAVKELQENSPALTILRSETDAALQKPFGRHLKATSVVLAKGDSVVSNHPFPGDPPKPIILSASHVGVCKPGPTFVAPVEQVVRFL
jgi:hypothetical protein